jgi:serine/threonine-protein kinase
MSTVYRAFDETLERWVAIKILQNEIAEDDDQLERFRREARAVARLNHPHVVTVIDAGEDQGCPYIVFEYISGETLKERIRRLGRLPVPEALAYSIEIARALEAAHAEMLVHRDVKPQNVLLDTDGRAKVTDFGIARSLEGGGDGLTLAGRVLGTTDYVSPEQALGREVTPQSDIYSLGIVMYEMLTGDVPFKADAPVAVAMKHVREPMPDVQVARPEVSANTAAIVDYATAKETRNRYQSVDQMLGDLEGALALEATRAGQTSGEATTVLRALPEERFRVPWRVRFPRRAAALTALIGAVVAVALVLVLSRTHEAKSPNAPPAQPKGTPALVAMKLPANAATDYDPFGGDGEHHADTPKAIDHNPITAWTTETYDSGIPTTKPGVGLYVDTKTPVAARRLDIINRQSTYSARVLAANGEFVPPKIESWTPVSSTVTVDSVARIPLDTKGKSYRYYLVWITKLPPGGKGGINELTLNR